MDGHGERGAPQLGVYRPPRPIRRSFTVDERDLDVQFTVQLERFGGIGRSASQIRKRFGFAAEMRRERILLAIGIRINTIVTENHIVCLC